MSGRDEGAARLRPRPWRNNLEALTLALTVAVLFKYFLVEAYRIPSGSMQPTLMGLKSPDGDGLYDRVLVDKLSYRWRDPERWEVAVFRYPLDRSRVFVKRVVGLPGEELRIRGGDLWRRELGHTGEGARRGGWEVLRKPAGVQHSTWLEVPSEGRWGLGLSYDTWSCEGHTLRATAAGEAVFPGDAASVFDHAAHGYPDPVLERFGGPRRRGGEHHVGDLKLRLEVEAAEDATSIVLELREGNARHRLELQGPRGRADAPARLTTTGAAGPFDSDAAVQLLPGQSRILEFQNLDDRLEARLDGELLVETPIAVAPPGPTGLRIATFGGGATFEDVRVWRDLYYRTEEGNRWRWTIPEGQYVVLGDNTFDSADSREWERTTIRVLDGPSGGESFAGITQGDHNPARNPDGEFPDEVLFRDEWGELHRFRGTRAHSNTEPAPFVPRAMIQGRALAVFWPPSPASGVHRLRWVR